MPDGRYLIYYTFGEGTEQNSVRDRKGNDSPESGGADNSTPEGGRV